MIALINPCHILNYKRQIIVVYICKDNEYSHLLPGANVVSG